MNTTFSFPYDYTPVQEMDLCEMFLDALEDSEVSYTVEQLDLIHKHIKQLETELEAAE